jgi:very-short-patch-repair endonuclease
MKCEICGFEGKSLVSHITRKHNMSIESYKKKYDVISVHTVTVEQKNHLSSLWKERMKIPYWKNKMSENKKSIWNVEYWISLGYSKDDAVDIVKKYQSENSKKRDYTTSPSILNKQHWIKKDYSIEDASQKISEIQSKLSAHSSKFTGHTHNEDSKSKISNSMKSHIRLYGNGEWASHFGDSWSSITRSNGEIEVFNYVSGLYETATANQFICGYNIDIAVGNKLIEYFGDFWHGGELLFNELDIHPVRKIPIYEIIEYDKIKINTLIETGYEVLIIWESEYNMNKLEVFDKIKKFLNDTSEKN